MTWKIGLGVLLFGMLLGMGSCFLFGSAAREASRKRQVATLTLEPGERESSVRARTEGSSDAQLLFTAELVLRQAFVERERDRGEAFASGLPVNYRVLDRAGRVVHLGAGKIRCSKIVPPPESPGAGGFDPRVRCRHRSERFASAADGELEIVTVLPAADEYGNPVRSARVEVFDRLGAAPGARAAVSVLGFTAALPLAALGLVVLLIGWWAAKRSAAAR